MGLSWHEMIVIGLVAIVVIPPRQLPDALRAAGSWIGRMKRLSSEFQRQLADAVRDEETEKLTRELTQLGNTTGAEIRKTFSADDSEGVRRRLRELTEGTPEHPSLSSPKPAPSAATAVPSVETAPP